MVTIGKVIHNCNFITKFDVDHLITQKSDLIIEFISKDENFIDILIWLTSINPYNKDLAEKFSKNNSITALPHLKILKTSLNLNTDKFFLELSNLIKPFDLNFSNKIREISLY